MNEASALKIQRNVSALDLQPTRSLAEAIGLSSGSAIGAVRATSEASALMMQSIMPVADIRTLSSVVAGMAELNKMSVDGIAEAMLETTRNMFAADFLSTRSITEMAGLVKMSLDEITGSMNVSSMLEMRRNMFADIQPIGSGALIAGLSNLSPRLTDVIGGSSLHEMRRNMLATDFLPTPSSIVSSRPRKLSFYVPQARSLHEMGMDVVVTVDHQITEYMERSLSINGIPPEGIEFQNDFLMYADWRFFDTQVEGSVTFSAAPVPGLIGIARNLSQSPEQQVIQRLKHSLGERVRRRVSPAMGNYRIFQGRLLVPNPVQCQLIEGSKCYLIKVTGSGRKGVTHPVLLKVECLKYPFGFLNQINSELTFYGELLLVPIEMLGEKYNHALLVRAIAYLR